MKVVIDIPKEVFNILRRHHREHGRDVDGDYTEDIYDEIKALPLVTPTRKKGKWIDVDTNQYTCSVCSYAFTVVPEDNHITQFTYCPHCGAEMESEDA